MNHAKTLTVAAFWVLLFVILWLILLRLPDQLPSADVDVSWSSALPYFAAQQLQFGTEIMFTFGPLGFIYPDVYTGYLFGAKIVSEIALKAVFAILLVILIQNASKTLSVLVICSVATFSLSVLDYLFFFTITYGLILACRFEKPNWLALALSIVFAVLSLIKISFLLSVAAGLLTLCTYWACTRRWAIMAVTIFSYIIALVSIWVIIGQNISGIMQYVRTGLYISSSYAAAMFYDELLIIELIGMATLVVVGMILLTTIWRSERRISELTSALILAQGFFFSWKYGFVRADPPHMTHYFLNSQLLVTMVWGMTRPTALSRRTFLSLIILFFGLTYGGLIVTDLINQRALDQPSIWYRMAHNAKAIIDLSSYQHELETKLEAAKARFTLPRVKKLVGQHTVDVFGFEQGVALLNNFDYRPRPAFQSYTAHHPFLLQANGLYYQSKVSPDFVLFKLQTIDHRFPAADDSRALDAIISGYAPVLSEQEYVLWEKIKADQPSFRLLLARKGTAVLGETIEIPNNYRRVWLTVESRYTWLGKLLELLYKPSEVIIEVTLETGGSQRFRLVTPVATTPFLISPFLQTTNDVLDLAMGKATARIISFRLYASSWHYDSRFHYKLFTRDEPILG